MIEVKTIKTILIIFVVQLFCNTITMFSIHTLLLFVHVLCLNMPPTVFGDRHVYVWANTHLDLT